jgi:hypothetical protein
MSLSIRTLFTLVLVMLCVGPPAYAEWVRVDENEHGVSYADPDTIQRKGNLVKMRHLYDWKTVPQSPIDPFLSRQRDDEYDCAEERTHAIAFTFFSGQMGTGQVVHSELIEDPWRSVAPDGIDKSLLRFACSKK